MKQGRIKATRFGLIVVVSYILATSVLISAVGVLFSISDAKNDARFIQKVYANSVVDVLREKVNDIVEYINQERNIEYEKMKDHIQAQVGRVYNIFYDLYIRDKQSLSTQKSIDKDLLGIAKAFFHKINGECLFIFNNSGNVLFGNKQSGFTRLLIKDRLIKNSGFIRLKYKGVNRLVFIKLFGPLKWYIVYCVNLTMLENHIKSKIISYLNHYRYGYEKHGYIFVSLLLNKRGGKCFEKAIVNPNRPDIVGRCLSDNVTDKKGNYYRKKYLKDIVSKGYSIVTYYYKIPGTNKYGKKISYLVLYKPWRWIIGTGFYLKDIGSKFYKQKISEVWLIGEKTLLIVFGMISLSVVIFLVFTKNLKKELDIILRFIDKFPEETGISVENFRFDEFYRVAQKLNEMAKKVTNLSKQQEEVLNRYTTLTNFMRSCVVIVKKVDNSIIIEDINSCVVKCMGVLNKNDVIGSSVGEFFESMKPIVKKFEMVFEGNLSIESVDILKNIKNCGYTRYFYSYVFKIKEDEAVMISDDITDSVLLYYRGMIEKDRLTSLINDVNIGVCIVDLEGKIMFSNQRLKGIFEGCDDSVSSVFDLFIDEKAKEQFKTYFKGIVSGDITCEDCIFEVTTFKGNKKWIEITAVKDIINNEPVVVLSFKDITEKYLKEEKIKYISLHDDLTGLYNRRFFREEFSRLFHSRSYPLALVIFDINGLKMVNDLLGHNWGDWLIKKVADILKGSLRGVDIVARIGGDEFVLLMPNTSKSGVEACVRRIIDNIKKENKKENQPYISVSIGYAIQEGQFNSPDELFSAADKSMYEQKFGKKRKDILERIWKSIEKMDPEATNRHSLDEFLKR